jgi:phosphotransferase system  glucose/maltose/N-acetylglucosamine-specific IIC component
MLMRIMPYIVTLICVAVLVIVMRLWKGKTLSWGWLGLLMVFLPQAQGLATPNGKTYVAFGLVSAFVGILIFTFDMSRRKKETA